MRFQHIVVILLVQMLIPGTLVQAQGGDTLSLFHALELAEGQFPLFRKDSLFDHILALQEENHKQSKLPNITLSGMASYQSDVVSFPFEMPGLQFPELPYERFQAAVEVEQVIYDGKIRDISAEIDAIGNAIDQQHAEVSMQQVREQVVQVFFAVLAGRQSQRIINNSLERLHEQIAILDAARKGGIADDADVLKLQAEAMSLRHQVETMQISTYRMEQTLALLTGLPVREDRVLIYPQELPVSELDDLQRPELKLLELQANQLEISSQLNKAVRQPKVSAFAQGGVGYPNPLNLFDDSFAPFGMIGVRFQMPLFDWGETGRKNGISDLRRHVLDVEKENIIWKLDIQQQQERDHIKELEATLKNDLELADIRNQLVELEAVKLKGGVKGSADYISALRDYQNTGLQSELHRLELSQTKAKYLLDQGTLMDTLKNAR